MTTGHVISRRLVEAVGADTKNREVVIFDFSGTTYLDDSAARLIGQLPDIASGERTAYVLTGITDKVAEMLTALGGLRRVPEGQLVETMEQAKSAARRLLDQERTG